LPVSIPSYAAECCETVSDYCTNFEREKPSPASCKILEPALLQQFPANRKVNPVDLDFRLPVIIGPEALTGAVDGCRDADGSPVRGTADE
jgi:hypothetical protein